MLVSTFDRRPKMGSTLKDLIRGDLPLARAIFNDPRKRRLIPKLQRDGWPIFEIAGKRCAFPADLAHYVRKATRSAPEPRGATKTKRGRRRKGAAGAAASTTEAAATTTTPKRRTPPLTRTASSFSTVPQGSRRHL
jgi:hypothetical protein